MGPDGSRIGPFYQLLGQGKGKDFEGEGEGGGGGGEGKGGNYLRREQSIRTSRYHVCLLLYYKQTLCKIAYSRLVIRRQGHWITAFVRPVPCLPSSTASGWREALRVSTSFVVASYATS